VKSSDQQLLEEAYLKIVQEGYYDPAIFKAIFLIGGPGSGKTFVAKRVGLASMGFSMINSDYPFEKKMKDSGLSLKMPDSEQDQRDNLRQSTAATVWKKFDLWIDQGLGIYMDITGANREEVLKDKQTLESLGYDTAMIFVNTDLQTAIARNTSRERTVDLNIVKSKWYETQRNIGFYTTSFRGNFFTVDNGKDSDPIPQIDFVYKKIMEWSKRRPTNPVAKKKIEAMKQQTSNR
jgi:shikimate kinase